MIHFIRTWKRDRSICKPYLHSYLWNQMSGGNWRHMTLWWTSINASALTKSSIILYTRSKRRYGNGTPNCSLTNPHCTLALVKGVHGNRSKNYKYASILQSCLLNIYLPLDVVDPKKHHSMFWTLKWGMGTSGGGVNFGVVESLYPLH